MADLPTSLPTPLSLPSVYSPPILRAKGGGVRAARRNPGAGLALVVTAIHIAVLCCATALLIGLNQSGYPTKSLVNLGAFIAMGLFVWSIGSWCLISRSKFDPYLIFLIAAYLFHFGQYGLEALGINPTPLLRGWFTPQMLFTTLLLELVSLGVFHLGALLAAARAAATPPPPGGDVTGPPAENLRRVGWACLALSFGPALINLKQSIALSHAGGYGAYYQQQRQVGLDNWQGVLASLLVPGAMFLLAGSKGRWLNIALTIFALTIMGLGWFEVGRRTDAVMPLLGALWVYHTCIKRLPLSLMAAGGLLMLFVVFPLISHTRGQKSENKMSSQNLQASLGAINNPATAQLNEMGFSALTVADTIELVPSQRPFGFGQGYLNAVMKILPNFLNPIDLEAQYGGSPDVWLMRTLYPQWAAIGVFYGFSFIAQGYLDFGWVGGPIAICVQGALLASFFFWAVRSRSPARVAMLGTFMVFLPHYSRGLAEELVRPFFWFTLTPYLLTFLSTKRRHVRGVPA